MAMTNVPYTPNPLTTVAQENIATIDRTGKTLKRIGSLTTTSANSFNYTLPDNGLFPAIYVIVAKSTAASPTASKEAVGFITVIGTSQLVITNIQGVKSSSTTADEIVVTLSAGVLTIAHATATNLEAKAIYLNRLF